MTTTLNLHARAARWLCLLFLLPLPGRLTAQTGLALSTHAPALSGNAHVEGSIQQLTPESVSLSGNVAISGDLILPGTPTVQLSGHGHHGGIVTGTGAAQPSSYSVALSGNAAVGRLRVHVDPVPLPRVDPPTAPTGTRRLTISDRNADIGDFRTLRDLTVSGNGTVRLPPGFYGTIVANGNAILILGRSDSTAPSVYGFERVSISGNGRLQVDGPTVATVSAGFASGKIVGAADHPDWLSLQVAAGDVSFSGDSSTYGSIVAPNSTVSLSGNAALKGQLVADRIRMEGNAKALLIPAPPPPSGRSPALPYAIGFEPADGFQVGSLAGQLGWIVGTGLLNVSEAHPYQGARSVEVAGGVAVSAHVEFPNGQPAVTFLEAFVRPHAAVGVEPPASLDLAGASLRLATGLGDSHWEALDGTDWRSAADPVPLDSAGFATAWSRLTVRVSYPDSKWDFYLNSRLVLPDLRVPESVGGRATHIGFGGPGSTQLDLVYAGYDNPIFADADNDGLEDAWEIANRLDISRNDRSDDRDRDGLTNLQEYILGTRADLADTDADGAADGLEVAQGRNPLKPAAPDHGALRLAIYRPN